MPTRWLAWRWVFLFLYIMSSGPLDSFDMFRDMQLPKCGVHVHVMFTLWRKAASSGQRPDHDDEDARAGYSPSPSHTCMFKRTVSDVRKTGRCMFLSVSAPQDSYISPVPVSCRCCWFPRVRTFFFLLHFEASKSISRWPKAITNIPRLNLRKEKEVQSERYKGTQV